jgi:regulator of RNase E activity RraA
MVGDADGVAVIPKALAAEVARDAEKQDMLEAFILQRVLAGEKLPGLYPINDQTMQQYNLYRSKQPSQYT